ncbi:hypothetical protein M1146_06030 [Patescibacteria group bacterium]|nr:hypothetical protein [Patescibacteria group bacterium]
MIRKTLQFHFIPLSLIYIPGVRKDNIMVGVDLVAKYGKAYLAEVVLKVKKTKSKAKIKDNRPTYKVNPSTIIPNIKRRQSCKSVCA